MAALLWILDHVENDNFTVLHIVVNGNTDQRSTQYVKEIAKEIGVYNKLKIVKREDLDFFVCLGKWGIPLLGKYRWCLYQFKIKMIEKHASTIQVTGIRRSEGHWRRKIKPVDSLRVTKSISINPILDWSKKQVIEYSEPDEILNSLLEKEQRILELLEELREIVGGKE